MVKQYTYSIVEFVYFFFWVVRSFGFLHDAIIIYNLNMYSLILDGIWRNVYAYLEKKWMDDDDELCMDLMIVYYNISI